MALMFHFSSLDKVRVGWRSPGFLKLFLCRRLYVCVCICVSAPEAINNYWHNVDPYNWLYKFYGCYMAIVVIIANGCGLGISMRCRQ